MLNLFTPYNLVKTVNVFNREVINNVNRSKEKRRKHGVNVAVFRSALTKQLESSCEQENTLEDISHEKSSTKVLDLCTKPKRNLLFLFFSEACQTKIALHNLLRGTEIIFDGIIRSS